MADPQSRSVLESYFRTGDVPTEGQFYELIASYVHKLDDGVSVYIDSTDADIKRFGVGVEIPEARLGIMQDADNESLISFHSQQAPAAADWTINFAGGTGFRISQDGFPDRFFIKGTNGFVGVGNSDPTQLMDLTGSQTAALLGLKARNFAALANEGWLLGHVSADLGTGIDQDGYFLIREELLSGVAQTRLSIRPASAENGNRMGINTDKPFTALHVWANYSAPYSKIDLSSGSGVSIIGQAEGYNLLFDHQGIQSRHAAIPGDSETQEVSALNFQPLGGEITIHGDDSDVKNKIVILENGFLGSGNIAPFERIDINGAIRIGDSEASSAQAGTIRYKEVSADVFDFQGYVSDGEGGGAWQSLTAGGGAWVSVSDGINYAGGNAGINNPTPQQKLDVGGAIKIGDASDSYPGSIRYTNALGFQGADAAGEWKSLLSPWGNVSGGINYSGGNVGVNTAVPMESIHTNGAIIIGNSAGGNAGTLRFFGGKFEGAIAANSWRSLQSQWIDAADGSISYLSGKVGIGTASSEAKLHVKSEGFPHGSATSLVIQNQFISDGVPLNRIGIDINNSVDYTSDTSIYDIGLSVSGVTGHTNPSRNIAAAFNGSIAITSLNLSGIVGESGKYVFSLQDSMSTPEGVSYPTGSPDISIVQIYSKRSIEVGGTSVFTTMNGNGDEIQLLKGAPIASYVDYSATDVYNVSTASLINSLNQRVLDLENRLKDLGLL
jgi:hypothetical protein